MKTITDLTKKLAVIKLKKYTSLSEIKADFDSLNGELIDLNSGDSELVNTLKKAAEYFNLLQEEDFGTNDKQRINEACAVISKFTLEINKLLGKWREECINKGGKNQC